MTPLMETITVTGRPFLIGVVVGYGLRSYVSLASSIESLRRDRP
jgi:hypothetical protein